MNDWLKGRNLWSTGSFGIVKCRRGRVLRKIPVFSREKLCKRKARKCGTLKNGYRTIVWIKPQEG
jgi:hypothetical protein